MQLCYRGCPRQILHTGDSFISHVPTKLEFVYVIVAGGIRSSTFKTDYPIETSRKGTGSDKADRR
jgi:hypothetical protein